MLDLLTQIQKAKSGDETALAGIIALEMPIIRVYARKAVSLGFEFDDAVQEGIIGLFDAINSFDVDKSASFKTYASVCIKNSITQALRTATRKKHQPLNTYLPLDERQSVVGPEQIAIEKENYATTICKINKDLSKFEKKVLRLFLQGNSYVEIAQKSICTIKAVDNALNRIRRKLKNK